MVKPKRTARAAWTAIRTRPRTSIAIGAGALLVLASLGVGLIVLRSRDRAPSSPDVVASATPAPAHTTKPVPPAPRPTDVVTFAQGCVTPACHANLSSAQTIHAPVAAHACDTCHKPDAGNHTYPLIAPATTICTSCHDMGAAKPFQHQAMTGAGCLACHDPHTSSGPFLLAASSVQATCVQCHPASEGMTVHPPYAKGQCVACHEPHASDNPRMLIAGPGAAHCGHCHQATAEAMAAARYTHRDVEGECLACHKPHASNEPNLLAKSPESLCLSCHQDVRATVTEAVFTHDAVISGRRCLTCHTPHAADNPSMLLTDQTDMCLSCHNKPVQTHDGRTVPDMSNIKNAPFLHGPVKSDQCAACHAVHGARYARLLKEINPELLVGPFNVRNYALCFSCHTQNLVLEQNTTVATDFRDGDLNLHYVHVKKGDRARSCGSCHLVHSSDLPKLMADTVNYQGSGWMMPVKFQETTNGGSCAPGCHEPLSYDRIHPVLPPNGRIRNGGTP